MEINTQPISPNLILSPAGFEVLAGGRVGPMSVLQPRECVCVSLRTFVYVVRLGLCTLCQLH